MASDAERISRGSGVSLVTTTHEARMSRNTLGALSALAILAALANPAASHAQFGGLIKKKVAQTAINKALPQPAAPADTQAARRSADAAGQKGTPGCVVASDSDHHRKSRQLLHRDPRRAGRTRESRSTAGSPLARSSSTTLPKRSARASSRRATPSDKDGDGMQKKAPPERPPAFRHTMRKCRR